MLAKRCVCHARRTTEAPEYCEHCETFTHTVYELAHRARDARIGNDIDRLCAAHGIDYEEFLMVQSRLALHDAWQQTHPVVRSTLEAMAEHLQDASMAFYVSFK